MTRRAPTSGPAQQQGVTLVEMMVALVVGLILMAGMVQLFVSNKQAYRIQEASNVVNENSRYVMDQLQYDIRMADHWGGVESDTLTTLTGMGSISADCTGNAAAVMPSGVFGLDGASGTPIACIPTADYLANTDVLVLRYAAPERVASGAVQNSAVYLRTAIGRRGMLFEGADKTSLPSDLLPANWTETNVLLEDPSMATYAVRTIVYFIRRCASQASGTANVCDGADDTTPTLTRFRLEGMSMVAEDVIAGVEQMQLSYGVDTNGDRSADVYRNATEVTAANQWTRVVNVKMSLLMRNLARDPTYSDSTTYRLYGGTAGATFNYTVPAADQQFRRKVYNATIQIRNMNRG